MKLALVAFLVLISQSLFAQNVECSNIETTNCRNNCHPVYVSCGSNRGWLNKDVKPKSITITVYENGVGKDVVLEAPADALANLTNPQTNPWVQNELFRKRVGYDSISLKSASIPSTTEYFEDFTSTAPAGLISGATANDARNCRFVGQKKVMKGCGVQTCLSQLVCEIDGNPIQGNGACLAKNGQCPTADECAQDQNVDPEDPYVIQSTPKVPTSGTTAQ